uniref:Uncharacterized protein n=1 Tax=Nelumbo nucifera TaxID=4432 RepID=A0A822YEU8_NELNU|nr:TPA_asm: hypothetical protein HUJ06_009878 [Nelumbo nucifera]
MLAHTSARPVHARAHPRSPEHPSNTTKVFYPCGGGECVLVVAWNGKAENARREFYGCHYYIGYTKP